MDTRSATPFPRKPTKEQKSRPTVDTGKILFLSYPNSPLKLALDPAAALCIIDALLHAAGAASEQTLIYGASSGLFTSLSTPDCLESQGQHIILARIRDPHQL